MPATIPGRDGRHSWRLFIGLTSSRSMGITNIDCGEQTVIASRGRVYARADPLIPFRGLTALLLVWREHELATPSAPARDPGRRRHHMPPSSHSAGSTRVPSYGIIVLATVAARLIVLFRERPHLLSAGRGQACSSTHDQPGRE